MNGKRSTFWLLMVLSPAIGELLSGSCPPLRFFNPLTFLVLVLFYGGGAVLVREARTRWDLRWGVILLAVAYAIWEEGTTLQTFFNPSNPALGNLAGYGTWRGIQWPWVVDMTFYHATMSILIPIAILDLFRPELRDKPLLSKRGIALLIAGILLSRTALVGFMLSQEEGKEHPYRPDPTLVMGSLLVVVILTALAYRSRERTIVARGLPLLPPLAFAAFGFLSQAANLLVPIGMAGAKVPAVATLAIQLGLIAAALTFFFGEVLHPDRAIRHLLAMIVGSLSFFIAFTPVHELGATDPSKRGMAVVGVVGLILLIVWSRSVVAAEQAGAEESRHIVVK